MASKNSNNDGALGCLIGIVLVVIVFCWYWPWLLYVPGIALIIFIINKIYKHKKKKNPKKNIKHDTNNVPSYFMSNNDFKTSSTAQKNSTPRNYNCNAKYDNDNCEYNAKKLKKYTSHKAEEIYL